MSRRYAEPRKKRTEKPLLAASKNVEIGKMYSVHKVLCSVLCLQCMRFALRYATLALTICKYIVKVSCCVSHHITRICRLHCSTVYRRKVVMSPIPFEFECQSVGVVVFFSLSLFFSCHCYFLRQPRNHRRFSIYVLTSTFSAHSNAL